MNLLIGVGSCTSDDFTFDTYAEDEVVWPRSINGIPVIYMISAGGQGKRVKWARQDLNLQPTDYESDALTN